MASEIAAPQSSKPYSFFNREEPHHIPRKIAEVVADSSWAFSSDRTGICCVLRVGFAFPHEAAVVKIVIDGGS